MITIEAPDGLGEVGPGDDLAALFLDVTDPRPGDIWVVTSKVVSKAEGRFIAEDDKAAARRTESRRVVARRGSTVIVEHRLGLVHAAAGIDSSNVQAGRALLLPLDPDLSARRLRAAVHARTGVRPIDSHVGRTDAYGNDLRVTEIAVADELAAAADLAKTKLGGRPLAIIRGLGHLVTDDDGASAALLRPAERDFFRLGRREAVLDAVLHATDQTGRWDELVELDGAQLVDAVTAALSPADAAWVRRLLA